VFRRLLEQNCFWAGAKGAVFALEPETGELVLQRELFSDRLSMESLGAALEDFAACIGKTKKMLEEEAHAPREEVQATHAVPAAAAGTLRA
jgi:hypothetical protein